MKFNFFYAIALLVVSCTNAQTEDKTPQVVKDAFTTKYPGAKVDKWEQEDANYEAEFKLNKVESSAVFEANGTFKELEQEIKLKELPMAAGEYCKANFADHKLSEVAKITDASGKVTYEAELSKGKMMFDVIFDENGNFVKKMDAHSAEDEEKD